VILGLADAAFEHGVEAGEVADVLGVNDERADVDHFMGDAAARELVDE
jgi:hypothetical protein